MWIGPGTAIYKEQTRIGGEWYTVQQDAVEVVLASEHDTAIQQAKAAIWKEAAKLVEERRMAILRDPTNPSHTEPFAELSFNFEAKAAAILSAGGFQ